jgi:hypothetical protein
LHPKYLAPRSFQSVDITLLHPLAVAISQSGETADILAALRQVKEEGYHVLAVTNVAGSSITRVADSVLYTYAGPEVAVAATKTFIAQLAALYALGLRLGNISEDERSALANRLYTVPNQLRRILSDTTHVERVGRSLAAAHDLFLIGRGLNYPVAIEGALKFKEVAYLHAEGCPAGELKHGPFALLTPETPCVFFLPRGAARGTTDPARMSPPCGPASRVPHPPQNLCPGWFAVPQDPQISERGVPHPPQNLCSIGFSVPQCSQRMLLLARSGRSRLPHPLYPRQPLRQGDASIQSCEWRTRGRRRSRLPCCDRAPLS